MSSKDTAGIKPWPRVVCLVFSRAIFGPCDSPDESDHTIKCYHSSKIAQRGTICASQIKSWSMQVEPWLHLGTSISMSKLCNAVGIFSMWSWSCMCNSFVEAEAHPLFTSLIVDMDSQRPFEGRPLARYIMPIIFRSWQVVLDPRWRRYSSSTTWCEGLDAAKAIQVAVDRRKDFLVAVDPSTSRHLATACLNNGVWLWTL
jgi:hypothetical protein